MLSYADISGLVKDLPSIAIISNLPAGPFERLAASFEKIGANIFLFNLTRKIKAQSYFDSSITNRVTIHDKGKDYLYKFTVLQNLFIKKHPHIKSEYEYFFTAGDLHVPLASDAGFQKCDLVLLGHFGLLIDADKISSTLAHKQTILLSCTANPFTGFCSCTAGCTKWQDVGCQDCPILGKSSDNKDNCATVFQRKKLGYAAARNFTVVTPSRWLGREIGQSILGRQFPRAVIPTDVRLDVYRPKPRAVARKALGLPDDRPILLTGSAGLRKNKGGQVLCEALRQLEGTWEGQPPRVLFFGSDAPFLARLQGSGLEAQSLGWVDDVHTLADIYAAADVFVSPSFQDNLPNTVNESLSCGTPVICFDRFSSEDVVIDGVTGFLARHPGLPLSPEGELIQPAPYEPGPGQCSSLADKIREFFALPGWRREAMAWECRRLAEATFNPALVAGRYLQMFRHMAALSHIPLP